MGHRFIENGEGRLRASRSPIMRCALPARLEQSRATGGLSTAQRAINTRSAQCLDAGQSPSNDRIAENIPIEDMTSRPCGPSWGDLSGQANS